ncbi:MAG: pyridoxal phosphate-dependent aminotransferase [Fusicatenibacter sp.]|nr:pyridoxal phosphate-dependent aminotransferase [Fusicatenibacter sp.]
MISEKMVKLGTHKSVIREIFEYSKQRAAQIGAENVFDFSIGNPNVPAPSSVHEAIKELLDEKDDIYLFGYTSAQGDADTRAAIAADLNKRFDTSFGPDNFYMTCGAAASLRIVLEALTLPGDEYIIFTPFFPEYRVFVEAAGGTFVETRTDEDTFQIDFDRFEAALNSHTKAVFLNSPNNPSGVVYTEESIIRLAKLLEKKSAEYQHPIYLIADEPYRELVYGETKVPYLTKYYNNTLVCYSYSKSLSLPGERIGYILVPDEMEESRKIYAAICGAGRALGYVCAPSLAQHVIARCAGQVSDLSVYLENRDLLYRSLTDYGYTCVHPDGAFYLFVKTLEPDAYAFCEKAKKYELLLVPGDDFGAPGYVRVAYCVTTDQIRRALPSFEKLAKEYQNA